MIQKTTQNGSIMKMTRLLSGLAIFLSLGGCLTRTANPSSPYNLPADAASSQNPNPIIAVSRIQDMEAELRKLRDSIERLEASGGDTSVKNLQDRISLIEKQLGIDSQKNQVPGTEGGQKFGAASPSDSTTRAGQASVSRKSSTAASAIDQSDEVTEVRNIPLTPDEKAYRAAYATFKSGALENAVTQFQDFLKKHPKSQFAPNAVY
ncbi:MAG: hypothetical protein ACP5U1_16305, partial [Desulfomonilaceae bacterium]